MERIMFDYSKLRGRIVEKYTSQKNFCDKIGMNEATLTSKLTGKTYFTQGEIIRISDLLEIMGDTVYDYFFKQKVEKTQ